MPVQESALTENEMLLTGLFDIKHEYIFGLNLLSLLIGGCNHEKDIVIAEPMSTAFNYLEDIRSRGYTPVILEPYIPHGYARKLMDEERKTKYRAISYMILLTIKKKFKRGDYLWIRKYEWQWIL